VSENVAGDRRFHQVEQVTGTLVRKFGRPTLGNKKNPFNELLYILLSSKTPPNRYQEVYRTLRHVYRRADSLADARSEDVAKVISHGGLQNRKARAITAIARRLKQEFGRVTLAPLAKMTNEEAEDFLTSFPEVSKKTARCVLMYALDRSVFPVDAHCFRIAQRLEWAPKGVYLTDRRADELQNGVPECLRRDLHVGMVLLGRHYCLPENPRCRECLLLEFCPTGAAS
jgi:endonuclease III